MTSFYDELRMYVEGRDIKRLASVLLNCDPYNPYKCAVPDGLLSEVACMEDRKDELLVLCSHAYEGQIVEECGVPLWNAIVCGQLENAKILYRFGARVSHFGDLSTDDKQRVTTCLEEMGEKWEDFE